MVSLQEKGKGQSLDGEDYVQCDSEIGAGVVLGFSARRG
jgi:hypothetical protein